MWEKLQASSYEKHLGIYLDQYLDWSPHVNRVSHKLVKANAKLCNCLFIYKHFFRKALSVFSHVFILAINTHEQNNKFASHGFLIKPRCNTSKYGANALVASAIASWNFFQK